MKISRHVCSIVVLVCSLVAGCTSHESQPEPASDATKNLNDSTSQQAEQGKQEQGKQEEAGTRATSESGEQQQASGETDSSGQNSPLDAAVAELNSKEVQSTQEPPALEPQEVHEELKSMVQEHWVRMHPAYEVWLDNRHGQVIVGGRISLREGLLEMFACPMGTKEHESVIATVSNAEIVHLGLLGVGAVKGMTAYWTEETGVVTAKGPLCEITIGWKEGDEEKKIDARKFVLDQESGKTMEHQWVFAGSRVWKDPEDPGYREYQADFGDMICVSNFPTAMMDINVESSTSNSGLLFTANPETIPPLGKPVLIYIKPDLSTNPSEEEIAAAEKLRQEREARLQAEFEKRMEELRARNAEMDRQEKDESASEKNKQTESGDGGP